MSNWIVDVKSTASTHYSYQENAYNVFNWLYSEGYSYAAIIAVLSNMEHESYINPGQQEIGYGGDPSRGYGLVQWTPASTKIIAYANSISKSWYDGNVQMQYFDINVPASWGSGSGYTYTFEQFKQLDDIYEATQSFFYQFERGTWHDDLITYAEFYNDMFINYNPISTLICILSACEIV